MKKNRRFMKELEDFNQKPTINHLKQDPVTSTIKSTQAVLSCLSSLSSSSSCSPPFAIVDEQRTVVMSSIGGNDEISVLRYEIV
jgi:hypothetical protein